MEYGVLLLIATAAIAWMGWRLWFKTRSLAFPLGMAMIYFWSIHGGWLVVGNESGLFDHENYAELTDEILPVRLDRNYALSLILYTAFALTVGATALVRVRPHTLGRNAPIAPLRLSHGWILTAAATAGAVSYWIVSEALSFASQMDSSGYLLTRAAGEVGSLYTVHLALNDLALQGIAFGLATYFSGADARYLVGRGGLQVLGGYLLLVGLMGYFCLLLGNRNQLLTAMIPGLLFYLANARRPRVLALAGVGFAGLCLLVLIGAVRGNGVQSLWDDIGLETVADGITGIGSSTETMAAHLSLYAVLDRECPQTFGSSFLALAASVVPRFVWADRPAEIYAHYATYLNLDATRGYTIHHATGWFLNFGPVGVVLGAIVFGWLWAALYNQTQRNQGDRPLALAVPCWVAFYVLTGLLPSTLRCGPEYYKGIAMACLLTPWLALLPGCRWGRTLGRGRRESEFSNPDCQAPAWEPAGVR